MPDPLYAPKAPDLISKVLWVKHAWCRGGWHRALAVIVVISLLGSIGWSAWGLWQAAEKAFTLLSPVPAEETRISPGAFTTVTPPLPTHLTRESAIQTLRLVQTDLARVKFSQGGTSRSQAAWDELAQLAKDLCMLEYKVTGWDIEQKALREYNEKIKEFKANYIILQPEISAANVAADKLHHLILDSSKSHDVLGEFHPDVARWNAALTRGLLIFEEYRKLSESAENDEPKPPENSVIFGSTWRRELGGIQADLPSLLEKLAPSPASPSTHASVAEVAPSAGSKTSTKELDSLQKLDIELKLFDEGKKLIGVKNWAQAEKFFRDLVSQSPNEGLYHYYLGASLMQQGKPEGEAEFTAATKLSPNLTQAHYFLGVYSRQRNDWDSALGHMRRAITSAPGEIYPRQALAECLAAQSLYPQAIEAYRDIFALDRDNWDANWGYAVQLWLSDDNVAALRAFQRCLELQPENPQVNEYIARAYWILSKRSEAIDAVGRAIALDAKNVKRYNLRGSYYRELRDWANAGRDYRSALELEPKNADAFDGLARIEYENNRTEPALAYCYRALEAKPDFISGKLLLSILLLNTKQFAEAEALLLAAIKAHPDSPEFPQNLASCYNQMKRPDAAMAILRRAVEDFPKSADLASLLAAEYEKRGEIKQAFAMYSRATMNEPKKAEHYSRYGAALARAKDYLGAVTQYEAALKLSPENSQLQNALSDAKKRAVVKAAKPKK